MSNSTPTKHYSCHELPFDSASVEKWLDKFVAYRLHALKNEPASFSPSYDKELLRSRAEWKSLLTEPEYRVFVCVCSADSTNPESWMGEWAGFSILYGPAYVGYGEPSTYDIVWFMTGLYAMPEHRKNRIADRLFAATVQSKRVPCAADLLQGTQLSQCRVKLQGLILPAVTDLERYYEQGGLKRLKQMPASEYLSSWGIELPPGYRAETKPTLAIIMEMIFDHTFTSNGSSNL